MARRSYMAPLLGLTAILLAAAARPEPAAERGDSLYRQLDFDGAISAYTDAIRMNPKDRELYRRRGHAYRCKWDFVHAIADLTEPIRLNPLDGEAYFNRAFLFYEDAVFEMTINDCTEAIRLKPGQPGFHFLRAAAWDYIGEHDKAIADYADAIRFSPKSADLGRGPEGDMDFYRVPRIAVSYRLRAHDYLEYKRDFDKAIADYTEALRVDPENASMYGERGSAYFAKGESGKAIIDFSEAIRLEPMDAYFYKRRAAAYAKEGDPDRAAADMRTVERLNREAKGAGAIYCGGYCRPRDEVIALCTKAIQKDPKSARAFFNRGWAYRMRGEWEKAIADFTRAIELDPKLLAAYYERAEAFARSGQKSKSEADVERANRIAAQPE